MTGEPIAAVCGFIAFYLLATDRLRPDPGRLMIAGLLAGWAVLCDFPAAIVAVPLAVYALLKDRTPCAAVRGGRGQRRTDAPDSQQACFRQSVLSELRSLQAFKSE